MSAPSNPEEGGPALVEVRPGRHISVVHLPHSNPDALTIFLAHGACATWRQFNALIADLRREHTLVTYDVFGCGESPKPADPKEAYSTQELLLDLQALYQRYEGRRNLLVGHSFGSSQVMRLTAWLEAQEERRERLHGMVLLASAFHVPDGGHPVFQLPLPLFSLVQPLISSAFKGRAIDPSADPELLKENARLSGGNPPHMVKAFYTQMRWVEKDTITSLRTPSVLIHGETDGIIPVHRARELAAKLPGSYLYILRQTGHQVMQERPSVTLELIQAFIKQVQEGSWPPPPAWPPAPPQQQQQDVPVSSGSGKGQQERAQDVPVHKTGHAAPQQEEEGQRVEGQKQGVDGAGAEGGGGST